LDNRTNCQEAALVVDDRRTIHRQQFLSYPTIKLLKPTPDDLSHQPRLSRLFSMNPVLIRNKLGNLIPMVARCHCDTRTSPGE
jgi:hypothetical protein